MRSHSVSTLLLAATGMLAACGLSPAGDAPGSLDGGGDDGRSRSDASGGGGHDSAAEANLDAPASPDGPVFAEGGASDAPTDAPPPPPDAPMGDGWTCTPLDAGIVGTVDLSTFTVAGTAVWNENSDGKITLTNSDNDQAGAAWAPREMPQVSAYDLTWSFRVGPDDTAGDGITFAVLQTATMPDGNFVGNDGDGLALQGLQGTGYAVAIDMYGTNEIRLVTMPSYTIVDSKANTDQLNDGNVHSVDVSWRAPSTLTATLHSTSGDLTVSSSNAGLSTTGAAWFGFTGATGGVSDSHNEAASLVVTDLCQ